MKTQQRPPRKTDPPAHPYRGSARHYAIEPHDFEWHQWHGRRFFSAGIELADIGAVRAALTRDEEVWSR